MKVLSQSFVEFRVHESAPENRFSENSVRPESNNPELGETLNFHFQKQRSL